LISAQIGCALMT